MKWIVVIVFGVLAILGFTLEIFSKNLSILFSVICIITVVVIILSSEQNFSSELNKNSLKKTNMVFGKKDNKYVLIILNDEFDFSTLDSLDHFNLIAVESKESVYLESDRQIYLGKLGE